MCTIKRLSRRSSTADQYEDIKPTGKKLDRFRVRVLQRNLVYCIGLTADIASPQVLRRYQYLGQYGELEKISVNRNGFTGKGQKGPSFSVYVTYKTEHEASLAILALNNLMHAGQRVHASFGTTKYCTYFLKKIQCPNLPDCYFLHCLDKENEIDDRDNRLTQELFDNQQQLAQNIIRKNMNKIEKAIQQRQRKRHNQNSKVFFPSVRKLMDDFLTDNLKVEEDEIEDKEQSSNQCQNQCQNNPEFSQSPKCMSEPEDIKGCDDQNLHNCLPEMGDLSLRKAQSQIMISQPESDLVLQSYIHHKILKNCMKSSNIKSKLQFAKGNDTHDDKQISCLRKYMLQHLRHHQ